MGSSTDEYLRFLSRHQPMPDDSEVSDEDLRTLDEARQHFLNHTDERAIPLWLNSFGRGSGYGVYQLVEDVILKYEKAVVLPHLLAALQSNRGGVRYWATRIASAFPSPSLVPFLEAGLRGDYDLRSAAITALAQIDTTASRDALHRCLDSEDEPELRELILESLSPHTSSP